MRRFTVAAIALLMLSAVSAKPIQIRDDAVLGYLDEARQSIRVIALLGSSSGSWELNRTDEVEKLRPRFDAARSAANDRPEVVAALRSHWIKLSQCLTLGNNAAAMTRAELARCQSELAERQAIVELEYR